MSDFENLIDGYRRFRLGQYREQRERYDELAQGQAPKIMVIACSDSRVDPTRVFDTGPGETFVLRNIANLVPPANTAANDASVAAALEYAITGIKVEHIVIFGHARCGGIAAALAGDFDNPVAGKHVHDWMENLAPTRDSVKAAAAISPDVDAQSALEKANVRTGIENLRSYKFVADAEKAGKVQLHGAVFDIADGSLKILDNKTGLFQAVTLDF